MDDEPNEGEDDGEATEEPSPLTIQQKLQRAQLEAEETRRREAAAAAAAAKQQQAKDDTIKPLKRAVTQRKSRTKRRSTLSPEELEGLMGM